MWLPKCLVAEDGFATPVTKRENKLVCQRGAVSPEDLFSPVLLRALVEDPPDLQIPDLHLPGTEVQEDGGSRPPSPRHGAAAGREIMEVAPDLHLPGTVQDDIAFERAQETLRRQFTAAESPPGREGLDAQETWSVPPTDESSPVLLRAALPVHQRDEEHDMYDEERGLAENVDEEASDFGEARPPATVNIPYDVSHVPHPTYLAHMYDEERGLAENEEASDFSDELPELGPPVPIDRRDELWYRAAAAAIGRRDEPPMLRVSDLPGEDDPLYDSESLGRASRGRERVSRGEQLLSNGTERVPGGTPRGGFGARYTSAVRREGYEMAMSFAEESTLQNTRTSERETLPSARTRRLFPALFPDESVSPFSESSSSDEFLLPKTKDSTNIQMLDAVYGRQFGYTQARRAAIGKM